MKRVLYFLLTVFLVSCTSNTIYKKPKDLIPKDSLIALLTDMYIASSANNVKNKLLTKESNYTMLVYEKYKIDSLRFDTSNNYYTSKIDEYTDILKQVKSNIDTLRATYENERIVRDSLKRVDKDERRSDRKERDGDRSIDEREERGSSEEALDRRKHTKE